jgi:hypothetical protein
MGPRRMDLSTMDGWKDGSGLQLQGKPSNQPWPNLSAGKAARIQCAVITGPSGLISSAPAVFCPELQGALTLNSPNASGFVLVSRQGIRGTEHKRRNNLITLCEHGLAFRLLYFIILSRGGHFLYYPPVGPIPPQ